MAELSDAKALKEMFLPPLADDEEDDEEEEVEEKVEEGLDVEVEDADANDKASMGTRGWRREAPL